MICTDFTSYLWMLAWRRSNKPATFCHNNCTNIYTPCCCVWNKTIPSAWFTIHYILIILLFNSINSELPKPILKQITIWPNRDKIIYKNKMPLCSEVNHAINSTSSPFRVNKVANPKHYSILWPKFSFIFLASLHKCLNSSFNWSPITNTKSNLLETEKFRSIAFML